MSWADGEAVTAEDICFTIEASLHPENNPSWGDRVRGVVRGCEVEAEHRAVILFEQDVAPNRSRLEIPVLPSHPFEGNPAVPADHPFGRRAFGSMGMRATLEADRVVYTADAKAERPLTKQWELRQMPEASVALAHLEAGEVHGIVELPPAYWDRVRLGDNAHLKTYVARRVWFIAAAPELAAEVRQALDLSLDRQALSASSWPAIPNDQHPPTDAVSGIWFPGSPFDDRSREPVLPDLPEAARLRSESGFSRTLVLGIRDGQAAAAPMLLRDVAAQLTAAGWVVESRTLSADSDADGVDLVIGYNEHDLAEDASAMFAPRGPANPWGAPLPELESLLQAIRKARYVQDMEAPTAELNRWLAEHRPVLPLFHQSVRGAWRAEVKQDLLTTGTYWGAFGNWYVAPSSP